MAEPGPVPGRAYAGAAVTNDSDSDSEFDSDSDSDSESESESDAARSATVNLRHVDFAGGEVVLVPTRWEFYWRRYLKPEDFRAVRRPALDATVVGMKPWGEIGPIDSLGSSPPGVGFATYRLRLLVPPVAAGREYGFRIQQQLTSYRVYANGELKLTAGRVGRDRASSEPERMQHSFFVRPDADGEIELILHVANFHIFRGGLRGVLALGERSPLEVYTNRKIAFDFILLGLFAAVCLYHLALFLMHPGESSFLWFTLLCLSFALRVPFMSEKTVNLVFHDLSWEFSLRLIGSINILSPAMMMFFLRSAFPAAVSLRAVAPYLIVSLPFLGLHFFDIKYFAPIMFGLYLFAIVPMLSHAAYVTLRMGLRGSVGARIMSIGVLLCVVFGFYAMYLNWKAEDAAPVALLAFAGLVMFQSVGLGQSYRDQLDARERLRMGLARSREALAAQRKDLEINLHDSLGGALTDLQVLVDRRLEDVEKSVAFDAREMLHSARERLDTMGRMFRGQLLFMEDLELTARDPIIGLRMVLLRRYTDAQREIDFNITDDAVPALKHAMADDRWRMDLVQLTRELCTNDLKYGAGESYWRFTLDKDRGASIQLVQSNALLPERSDPVEEERPGEQAGDQDIRVSRARERVLNMGGEIRTRCTDGRFSAVISLPRHSSPS
ncbi:MAG: 7TM-DISM domain-containing protein [bacterium]|nr:7TM-DISM domain-containing protein [bacterium]